MIEIKISLHIHGTHKRVNKNRQLYSCIKRAANTVYKKNQWPPNTWNEHKTIFYDSICQSTAEIYKSTYSKEQEQWVGGKSHTRHKKEKKNIKVKKKKLGTLGGHRIDCFDSRILTPSKLNKKGLLFYIVHDNLFFFHGKGWFGGGEKQTLHAHTLSHYTIRNGSTMSYFIKEVGGEMIADK